MLRQFLFWGKYWLMGLGLTEEEGQGLVEYALILVLIAIVVIVALNALGVQVGAIFENITGVLQGEIQEP